MAEVKIGVDAEEATRSIQDLQEVFERFAAASEKQTDMWDTVAYETRLLADNIDDLRGEMEHVAELFSIMSGQQDKLEHGAERTARHWQGLGRHARDFAGHVKSATDSILKWAGVGGLIMGAAGFGAEHALFDMAANVGARRSTAMGYGTTYGGLQAARVNYQRFGDADSTLGNVASAQSGNFDKQLGLNNLGVAFKGRDSMDVMADAMDAVARMLEKRPESIPLQQYAHNYKLDEIFSVDTLQRMQGHGGEVREMAGRMRSTRKGLDLAPDVQKKWQDLATKIETAAKRIETVLINKLVAIEPGLQKLSDALVKTAGVFFAKDGPVEDWLKEINSGLEKFAGYIDTDDFKRDVGDLLTNVADAAKTMWELGKSALTFLHWLAQLTGADAGDGGTTPAGGAAGGLSSLTPGGGTELPRGGSGPGVGLRSGGKMPPGFGRRSVAGAHGAGQRGAWWTDDRVQHAYDKLVAGGLSPREAEGQIARMAFVEAGSGPTASNNIGGGHLGIYQASRDRQQHFGGSTDFDAQLDAIVKEKNSSEALSHKAGLAAKNDYEAATAASMFERAEHYNAGTGTDDYTNRTAEAIPQIHKIVASRQQRQPAAPPARVTVTTNPGGNVHTAAGAAAAPQ